MEKARYGQMGRLVTVEQFMARAGNNYKAQGILPYCPACGEVVEICGANSPNVTSRFDHQNMAVDADPLDDCILANRGDPRFRGLEPSDWDHERGAVLRAEFFQDDNVKTAYSFCLRMCGQGNLPMSVWKTLIRRADKKNIWSYKDIPLWVIPYILLVLENLQGTSQKGATYGFHFILKKPSRTKADTLWIDPGDCAILKVFSASGQPMKGADNPFPLSEADLTAKAGKTDWISVNLLRALRA